MSTPQRIQRKRTKGWKMPENTIYVGRGASLGNPFRIYEHCAGKEGDWGVEDSGRFCIPMSHGWTKNGAARLAASLYTRALDEAYPEGSAARKILAMNLAGKNLACWCPLDQPCHADVLLELANGDRLPQGTPVLFWPGAKVGEGRPSITRTPIWKMGDGTEVVSVDGYPGGIALTHIQAIPEATR